MKKKLVSLLLAFVMVLSTAPLSFAENAETVARLENFTKTNTYIDGQFSDVSGNDWFAENVKTVYELGLMNGNSATTFNPKGNITQAEALTITARIHKIYKTGNDDFSDIKQEMLDMESEILEWCNNDKNSPAYKEFYDAWYAPYVYYLYTRVWTEGRGEYPQFPALAFEPEYAPFIDTQESLIRARLVCAILIGALPETEFVVINNIPNNIIPDVNSTDDFSFYDPTVYLFYRAGILTGNDIYGTFSPYSSVTRAEVAAIIGRMVDKTQRKSFILQERIVVPESVSLAGTTTINVGETTQWKATVAPANANQWVSWTSGNPSVATVDSNGNITAHKAGQSNITVATVNGIRKTVLITVASNNTQELNYSENEYYDFARKACDYAKKKSPYPHSFDLISAEAGTLDGELAVKLSYFILDASGKNEWIIRAYTCNASGRVSAYYVWDSNVNCTSAFALDTNLILQ